MSFMCIFTATNIKIMEKRYVAYYRISKDNEKSKSKRNSNVTLGLEAQKQIVNHFYKPEKEFIEMNKSGKNITDRPILREAIDYCTKYKCYLVCAKQDRLSRSVEDCRHILEALQRRLILCDIPAEELDLFILTLFAAFSEREREFIGLRTSQALQRKLANTGKWQKENPEFTNGNVGRLGVEAIKEKAKNNSYNRQSSSIINGWRSTGLTWKQILANLQEKQFYTSTGKQFTSISQVKRMYHNFPNTWPIKPV